ncbi:Abi family protein [Brevibacterium luteolum]|uniref:Abi family protein n=1 Tax=Brevibacterium luteolum TaxID=199591 RepID=UPI00223BD577|nr:Abi family protein [Brevibacterium luteolum]MCT1874738.1 Abi family protein [Brevibacterium luteolum]MCT1891858.1 Abi family protein [Brevibacterium luteolum]MCT1925300.1 Abi family protein [Brevibacterium luteolum]
MTLAKQFKTYAEQVELLRSRGMRADDPVRAEHLLTRLNYYRLSGYWYPMRRFAPATGEALDEFVDGASFDLVIALYGFDERLRHAVFNELDRVELAVRAMLGYELGRIDPLVHLSVNLLAPRARQRRNDGRSMHEVWLGKYTAALKASREDFVAHHKAKYSGDMPIWAAVEIMDWGMLSHLYGMSPNIVRNRIADQCQLKAPQLESWLKPLNIVRNYAAHHARMFNRVYDIKPKLSDDRRLIPVAGGMNRAFGQLTLIQYLHRELGLSSAEHLPALLRTYPDNEIVPLARTGAPEGWANLALWAR